MSYQLATFALAPILLAQGLYVRRVTARLPEPVGARHGNHGSGASLRLLIVGDSAAAGVGAHSQEQALSGGLVAALSAHYQLCWKLIAKTGNNAVDVLTSLHGAAEQCFDVAVVSVGVNDVTAATSLTQWRQQLSGICECLQSKFKVKYVLLTAVPPMHAFPALPQPLRWCLGKRAAALNQVMQQLVISNPNWQCVQPDFPLTAEFIATDGFHPSPRAYLIWAELAAATIKQQWQAQAVEDATA